MTSFVIAPYKSRNGLSQIPDLRPANDLRIEPTEYKRSLSERWPGVAFYDTPSYIPLSWGLLVSKNGARVFGVLDEDMQTVSLDTPYEEFFLWHRSVIPSHYALFLFNDSDFEDMELTSETTLEELKYFVGGTSAT